MPAVLPEEAAPGRVSPTTQVTKDDEADNEEAHSARSASASSIDWATYVAVEEKDLEATGLGRGLKCPNRMWADP